MVSIPSDSPTAADISFANIASVMSGHAGFADAVRTFSYNSITSDAAMPVVPGADSAIRLVVDHPEAPTVAAAANNDEPQDAGDRADAAAAMDYARGALAQLYRMKAARGGSDADLDALITNLTAALAANDFRQIQQMNDNISVALSSGADGAENDLDETPEQKINHLWHDIDEERERSARARQVVVDSMDPATRARYDEQAALYAADPHSATGENALRTMVGMESTQASKLTLTGTKDERAAATTVTSSNTKVIHNFDEMSRTRTHSYNLSVMNEPREPGATTLNYGTNPASATAVNYGANPAPADNASVASPAGFAVADADHSAPLTPTPGAPTAAPQGPSKGTGL